MRRCLAVLALAPALAACAGAHSVAPRLSAAKPRPGTQWVGTHGIEVAVPAGWQLGRGICGTPKEDTVLWNEDPILACRTEQPPGLSVVDGLAGAAVSAAVALGLVWLVGAVALQTPGARALRADIQRSAVLRALNGVLPPFARG